MRFLRKILLVITLIAINNVAHSQRIQVVDTEGMPIAYVCVTNEKGYLIGSTNNEGWLDDAKGSAVLNLSHVAFRDKVVRIDEVTDGRIIMEDVDFNLPELEVKPKELAYVQTYFRLIYFDEDGPIYFRGGVIDNTYEFANHKTSSKTRSLSKGRSGFIRFLISTIVGRYIDKLGQIGLRTDAQRISKGVKDGHLTLSEEINGRSIVSDSICILGYLDYDTVAGIRTSSFDSWKYSQHRKEAEERAKAKKEMKKKKDDKKDEDESEDSYYEVFHINKDRHARVDDFIMRQLQTKGKHSRTGTEYMILLQAYATDRNYINKNEYKQLRKENKVDMEIHELKQFEKAHNIPPLAPDIQAQIDKLFEKELNKKKN